MTDIIEGYGHSLLQHGKNSNRIYLMKCDVSEVNQLISHMNQLALDKNYSKIVVKIPDSLDLIFKADGYQEEAAIPSFYCGKETCKLLGKYLCPKRKSLTNDMELKEILYDAIEKQTNTITKTLPGEFKIRQLLESDIPELAQIYSTVFKSYPFPIFKADYLLETMSEHVLYFGVFHHNHLVAASSSETDPDNLNSEMTDFAVLPAYRGQQLALHLLHEMEKTMIYAGYHLLYTIARASSHGMNTTFARANYRYGGTLNNNTQISGSIESMNIWYKEI
ncbi:putative beta-lysine N-acetyltransferase [Acetobacterium sp.]|jgi:putative beta-lysine N-acetyltransferase|uniref:putative beta-lysine N-acetyltransferase n=1 Tax=Acetobacterium sp. TaxID=1872094 RepID=UPI000CAE3AB1|nr:putative beta-lysine N-acetyltransferase [Acetobacterium sp.]MDO9493929.1 putative beta-lysine N-acetyltransferase [Acetobacterium sp.]PKM73061.1 MAG: putative beta-lysine N-acetyltransferase [Firmicutes bacterium HGW-Firmicutes-17]